MHGDGDGAVERELRAAAKQLRDAVRRCLDAGMTTAEIADRLQLPEADVERLALRERD